MSKVTVTNPDIVFYFFLYTVVNFMLPTFLASLMDSSCIRCFDAMYVSASYQVRSRILRQLSHAAQQQ